MTRFSSCVPRRGEVCLQFACPAHLLNPAVRLGRRRRQTNDALRRDRGCQFLIQDPWTLEEIAQVWGFSRERVRQIEETALLKYILHLVGMQAEKDPVDPGMVALYWELKNRKEHHRTKQRELARGKWQHDQGRQRNRDADRTAHGSDGHAADSKGKSLDAAPFKGGRASDTGVST